MSERTLQPPSPQSIRMARSCIQCCARLHFYPQCFTQHKGTATVGASEIFTCYVFVHVRCMLYVRCTCPHSCPKVRHGLALRSTQSAPRRTRTICHTSLCTMFIPRNAHSRPPGSANCLSIENSPKTDVTVVTKLSFSCRLHTRAILSTRAPRSCHHFWSPVAASGAVVSGG
jgi:hypothetical protein